MAYQYITSDHSEWLATITIQRPQQLNALNKLTIEELNDAIIKADQDPSVRCIIITGSGYKAFVAGADIKEFADFNAQEGQHLATDGQYMLFDLLAYLSTPSIAAINGFALGGGLELAMACHIRVASSKAKMGLPEVSLGVIPGYGGTQRLSELVGKGKALEMITTAGMLNAKDALQWGLVNHVCEPEELLSFCQKIASKIAKNAPFAIAQAIKCVNAATADEGYEVEKAAFGACFATDDFKEGTTAFMDKRKPHFTGN
ncbi:MAG: enoyl-CoA hydratase-related protein [Bacteroidota bacterium]|nr:enoyl-CoA hydratase-related protein [Bacteroidota bacterium]